MSDKSLSIRYLFYFLISLFVFIFIINVFKEDEIQYSLENYKKNVHKEYLKYSNEYKNSSELIYFNEFVKNKQLVKTFKNMNNMNNMNFLDAKKEIYNHLKDSYLFYKTLDVNDISFYSSSNNLLLSMQENNKNDSSEIVAEVILNKKELSSFKIVDDNYYLLFSKPIFDENLNFLGVINIEFDFRTLIKKLEYNSDFSFSMIASNQIKLNKSHSVDFPIIFIPILKSFANENSLYLVAYYSNKDSNIAKINKYFNILFVVITLLVFIIFYYSFKVKYFKMQKLSIEKEYQELHTQIDDNVIKVETDLNGIITYASKQFCKISGYSHKELLGRNVNLLKHSNIASAFFQKLWSELKTNNIWEGEIKNQDRYGNSYWIKGVIFPKYDFDNKIIGYVSIRSNITDTKQLEKINKLLKEDLSNKLNEIKMKDKTLVDSTKVQLMSKILDSLDYQWKQPILSISSLIYNLKTIIKNEENSKDKLELIQQTEFELKNLSEVLNEIKYLFQQNQNKISKVTKIIKESILATQEELQANNIKIKYDLESEISTDYSFNELKNIIFNMIKNCIEQKKLNNQDEVIMLINIIKEEDLLIKIEDNIKGENKKIDENRYSNSNLYLVKLFIEKNKGLFWFESTNYDTTYYIKLKNENI
jgi:aerotaxis receptor